MQRPNFNQQNIGPVNWPQMSEEAARALDQRMMNNIYNSIGDQIYDRNTTPDGGINYDTGLFTGAGGGFGFTGGNQGGGQGMPGGNPGGGQGMPGGGLPITPGVNPFIGAAQRAGFSDFPTNALAKQAGQAAALRGGQNNG